MNKAFPRFEFILDPEGSGAESHVFEEFFPAPLAVELGVFLYIVM
jgi:hypothetical protein